MSPSRFMNTRLFFIFIFFSFAPILVDAAKTVRKNPGISRKCVSSLEMIAEGKEAQNTTLALSRDHSGDLIEIIPGVFLRVSFFKANKVHSFRAVGEPIGTKEYTIGRKIYTGPQFRVEHRVVSMFDELTPESLKSFVAENIYYPELINENGFKILMRFIELGYDENVVRSLTISLHGFGQFRPCKGWAGSPFGLILLKRLIQNGRADELIDSLMFFGVNRQDLKSNPWVRIPEVSGFIRQNSLSYVSAKNLRDAGFGAD